MKYAQELATQIFDRPEIVKQYINGEKKEDDIVKWLGGGFGSKARQRRSSVFHKIWNDELFPSKNMDKGLVKSKIELGKLQIVSILPHLSLAERLDVGLDCLQSRLWDDGSFWVSSSLKVALKEILGGDANDLSQDDIALIRDHKFFQKAISMLLVSKEFDLCDFAFKKLNCTASDIKIEQYLVLGMHQWSMQDFSVKVPIKLLTDLVVVNYAPEILDYLSRRGETLPDKDRADFLLNNINDDLGNSYFGRTAKVMVEKSVAAYKSVIVPQEVLVADENNENKTQKVKPKM